MVIKELSSLWLAEKKPYVKTSTFAAYSLLVVNPIVPWFGAKESFKEEDVQAFVLSELGNGISEKTAKDILVVLGMIQKYGVKKGYLYPAVLEVAFPTQRKKKGIEVMTRENYRKLFDYLLENFSFENLGILICLSSGMRIGEICALKWSDIDLEEKVIKVRHSIQRVYFIEECKRYTKLILDSPKTKESNRDIPMTAELQRVVKPLMKVVRQDYFVISNDEKPIEPRTYRNYYKRLIKRLGLPELKFHGLRHSFATRLIEAKADVKTVSTILGHANVTTTLNLYVHPNFDQKKSCIEKMMRLLH